MRAMSCVDGSMPPGHTRGKCFPCRKKRQIEHYATNVKPRLPSIYAERRTPEWLAKTAAMRKRANKKWQLKSQFNLTPEQYAGLLAAAGGRCNICDKERPLGVDHIHETGYVRGMLCGSCNRAIGLLGDSASVASRAAGYLLAAGKKILFERTDI